MPLCIICEQEKPESEFKVRHGKVSTECEECIAALKPKRSKKDRTLVQALIDAPQQRAPEIKGSSEARLKQAIEIRMEFYKSNALEALYDLAMMDIKGANSATLQVKYLAACRLAGPAPEPGNLPRDNPIQGVLDELNQRYHAQAPKIREIRERVLVMDNGPQVIADSAASLPQ